MGPSGGGGGCQLLWLLVCVPRRRAKRLDVNRGTWAPDAPAWWGDPRPRAVVLPGEGPQGGACRTASGSEALRRPPPTAASEFPSSEEKPRGRNLRVTRAASPLRGGGPGPGTPSTPQQGPPVLGDQAQAAHQVRVGRLVCVVAHSCTDTSGRPRRSWHLPPAWPPCLRASQGLPARPWLPWRRLGPGGWTRAG